MKRYIAKHINQNKYVKGCGAGDVCFQSLSGWRDHLITDSMIYSHRRTDYAHAEFDETAHIHDYCELVIYVSGNVELVTDKGIYSPTYMTAALFSAGTAHNIRLRSPSVYERYVFYFYPDIFHFSGKHLPFGGLFDGSEGVRVVNIPTELSAELISALKRLDGALEKDKGNRLLSYVQAMSVLGILSDLSGTPTPTGESLPPRMLEIQRYIDENYADIASVSAVAEHFFYSREYVSRMFKKYYNVSVSDYLARLRVVRAIELMKKGATVTDACFSVGFGSASAFYLTFRKIMGMSPSEYVKREGR